MEDEKEYMKTIEINGVKLEIDLRTAKRVDTFKIGDNVKVLKKGYGDGWNTYSGVIIDFVAFKERPAIVVAIFKEDYNSVDIEYETITQDSKDIEFVPCLDMEMKINKERVIDKFNAKIDAKRTELDDLEAKKEYFVKNFSKYFDKKESEAK